MRNGNDIEVGSAMLLAEIINRKKAKGVRVGKLPIVKSAPGNETRHRTLYFIFSGFKRRWIRMTDPGPEAA